MIPELHPLVIHFPIALFSTAILFDVIFILANQPTNMIVGWWVMLLALISSAAAIATGIIDDILIGHLGSVFPIWENHGWVQILSSMVFLILIGASLFSLIFRGYGGDDSVRTILETLPGGARESLPEEAAPKPRTSIPKPLARTSSGTDTNTPPP